jgi:hypothetical protein
MLDRMEDNWREQTESQVWMCLFSKDRISLWGMISADFTQPPTWFQSNWMQLRKQWSLPQLMQEEWSQPIQFGRMPDSQFVTILILIQMELVLVERLPESSKIKSVKRQQEGGSVLTPIQCHPSGGWHQGRLICPFHSQGCQVGIFRIAVTAGFRLKSALWFTPTAKNYHGKLHNQILSESIFRENVRTNFDSKTTDWRNQFSWRGVQSLTWAQPFKHPSGISQEVRVIADYTPWLAVSAFKLVIILRI